MFLRCDKCLLCSHHRHRGLLVLSILFFSLPAFWAILSFVHWDLLPIVFVYSRHLIVTNMVDEHDFWMVIPGPKLINDAFPRYCTHV